MDRLKYWESVEGKDSLFLSVSIRRQNVEIRVVTCHKAQWVAIAIVLLFNLGT